MIFRKIMEKIGIIHLINGETVRRLTGSTVDFMSCAIFMGIQIRQLQEVVCPFTITVLLGTISTFMICLWFGRRAPEYGFERSLVLFGYCTGTAASGLLLLRIVAPEFAPPVAVEVGLMNVFAFFLFKPISWSMPFVPAEGFPMLWIFLAYTVPLHLLCTSSSSSENQLFNQEYCFFAQWQHPCCHSIRPKREEIAKFRIREKYERSFVSRPKKNFWLPDRYRSPPHTELRRWCFLDPVFQFSGSHGRSPQLPHGKSSRIVGQDAAFEQIQP